MQDIPVGRDREENVSSLRKLGRSIPFARRLGGKLRRVSRSDHLFMALYQKLFERGRLKLPGIAPEKLIVDGITVELPALHPLFAGEDAPMVDLVCLIGIAKSREAARILEVGTYRARTTLALHLNCPQAQIVSYDIQVLPSPYRLRLNHPQVELRHASFCESSRILLQEPPFNIIFIDGAHDVKSVCADSELAFKLLSPSGIIIWHDYRYNGYFTKELRVPEALELIQQGRKLFHVTNTMCAVYSSQLQG
jgi:predicted O-methyltransferase YrrM